MAERRGASPFVLGWLSASVLWIVAWTVAALAGWTTAPAAVVAAAGLAAVLVAVARDAAERRDAEWQLRVSEARLRSILETQRAVVGRVTPGGIFTYINDHGCRIVGEPRERILGRPFTDWVHPDDLARVSEALAALPDAPHRSHVVSRARTPGGWRWLEWEGAAILDAQGTMVEVQTFWSRRHRANGSGARAPRERGGYRGIAVSLAAAEGVLRLEVRNDGRGFDPAARQRGALGLVSMEERALALGGRLDIVSAPGEGTTVRLSCPLIRRVPRPAA